MRELRGAVSDYLTIRRALGFRLVHTGRLLGQFVGFVEAAGTQSITTQLAVRWATLPAGSPAWHAQRLTAVRCFARWWQAFDPDTEVPPSDVLPARFRRAVPYLYSEADITALLGAAGQLRSPLAAATMQTFIGLLFVTGMRRGEALGLDRDDLDPATGVLTVRQAKLDKPRQLPLHPSTVDALAGYAVRRDQLCRHPRTAALFVSTTGARLTAGIAWYTFRALLRQAGIGTHTPACRPRIHDARHSFAVSTLLGWYRDGGDVQARLPLLSTYLGHADPSNTYWYLQATPELLALAADRMQHTAGTMP
jgi:integrase